MINRIFQTALAILPLMAIGQNPQGFFLNDFQTRTFTIPQSTASTKSDKAVTVNVTVDFTNTITPVSKYLYGNNANIWMGKMIDQPTLINNITMLKPNILRFPAGTLGGLYFWDATQPPADAPAQIPDANGNMINAGYRFGKDNASWTCTLDNYYEMLQMTGNTGMITVNYDYARYSTAPNPVASAAHYAANWVRYDNGRTKYWEVGNECNGTWQAAFRINQATNQDGQPLLMSGELYGKHFKVFADSMRKAANDIGKTIYIGAYLLEKPVENWQNNTDRQWNTGVLQHAANSPDYYIIHSYYTPYNTNSTAADILNTATTVTPAMMTYLDQSMTTAGVTKKPIAMTEYNIFATGSKQQSSFINGMHTTIVLAEMIKNKYGMAARWDLANAWEGGNDHGIFGQGDEGFGLAKWNPRPAFYYMYYFQKYFGDTMVSSTVSGSSDVLAYSSKFGSGEIAIVLINKSKTEQIANVTINNYGYGDNYYVHSLTGGSDNGDFSLKVSINGTPATQAIGGPSDFENIKPWSYLIDSGIKVTLPARSVQFVMVEKGTNIITGINETIQEIKIYPNPTEGVFSMDLEIIEESHLSILDMNGQEFFSKTVYPGQPTIKVESKLVPGVYLVRTKGKSKMAFAKIVVK